MDQCPQHDDLIKQQAATATDVKHIRQDVTEIKTMLLGPNGTGGMVGWMNQSKGKTTIWGAVGGIVVVAVGIAIRAISKYF